MHIEKTLTRLRNQVGFVHERFYREKNISKEDFEARRDRLNGVMTKLRKHKDVQNAIARENRRKESYKKTARFMVRCRDLIEDGKAEWLIVLNREDGGVDYMRGGVVIEDRFPDMSSDTIMVVGNMNRLPEDFPKIPSKQRIISVDRLAVVMGAETGLPVTEYLRRAGIWEGSRFEDYRKFAEMAVTDFHGLAERVAG